MPLAREKLWRFSKNKKQQLKTYGEAKKHDIFLAG
jgi:hypothetical protein